MIELSCLLSSFDNLGCGDAITFPSIISLFSSKIFYIVELISKFF